MDSSPLTSGSDSERADGRLMWPRISRATSLPRRHFVMSCSAVASTLPGITGSPADITATKGGETFYFEVKFTRQGASYFGAATLTEWDAALKSRGAVHLRRGILT